MNSVEFKQLVEAVKHSNIEGVTELVQASPELLACRMKKGDTLLHYASRLGFVDAVRVLARHVDINSRNEDGKSALHEAVSTAQEAVVAFLLTEGAEVNMLKIADWLVCTILFSPDAQ